MRDLLTTRNQNIWKEQIEKETISRMTWKLKHSQEHPTLKAEKTRKRRELPIPKAGTTLLPPINVSKQPLVKMSQEPDFYHVDVQNLREMRPVSPHISRLLYDGVSKEGKGRSMYLKKQKDFSPEEKFPHPILSSWDYGWRLGDVVKELKAPIHGRSKIVRDTFYNRNGVLQVPASTDKLL
ncbi:protein SPMIP1-like [Pelodytes ibericus]